MSEYIPAVAKPGAHAAAGVPRVYAVHGAPRAASALRGARSLAGLAFAGAALLLAGPAGAEGVREPTRASGIGVWYAPGAPETSQLWQPGDPGERLFLRGRVLDGRGSPVAGALVELWHADAAGVVHADRYRASLRTRPSGQFEVSTVLPGYIWGPRHIHVIVTDPHHPTLVTRVFFMRDPVLGEAGDPELAIALEDGRRGDEAVLLGAIELILPASEAVRGRVQ